MIYIDNQIYRFDMETALASVSAQRRIQALRYKNEHDRRLSLAAYMLLQRALNLEYGIMEPPLFGYEDLGKPTLIDHSDIFFSLSHCHEAAACAVAKVPIGIDVESLSSYDAEVVKAVMNDDEQRQIACSPDSRLTFMQLWTMKESLLKMTGEGMSDDMRQVLSHASAIHNETVSFDITVYPQFVCAVCFNTSNARSMNK